MDALTGPDSAAGIDATPNPADDAGLSRCGWAVTPLSVAYHDAEWGVPVRDDRRWFEFLILEGAQAGLSWELILQKRPAYRRAFDDFRPELVAAYDEARIAQLLADPGIVRNRLKIRAAVTNAAAFLQVQQEFGSFDAFIRQWAAGQWPGGAPRLNRPPTLADIPAATPESAALSRELRRRGFKFVGPTICYALMQATGLVNDHLADCAWGVGN